MRNRFTKIFFFTIIFFCLNVEIISGELLLKNISANNKSSASELIELLNNLAQSSDNSFFKQHCISIINVIEAKSNLSASELSFIDSLYKTFSDTNAAWNASELSSYLARKRPFIISWTSPTDGVVSLGWLLLPDGWDPEKSYPLYVTLHGLYGPYENPIEYMTRYLSPGTIVEKSFEDGYSFFPWGRGNRWYEGISETDIWEGINIIENWVKVNPEKKYLTGHSMGGYGAWALGQKSPEIWAALGIYAGALWYSGNKYLNLETAQKLKNVPVYIVCGEQDGLLGNNQTAYQLLQDAGNTNVFFTTFPGGHESLLENWQNMFAWMKQFTNENQTSIDINDNTPFQFKLYDNYPNPFNPTTNLEFRIADFGLVSLKVFDVLGREVETLVNEEMPAGVYKVSFSAEGGSASGGDASSFASGIYFYELRTEKFSSVKKMILMK